MAAYQEISCTSCGRRTQAEKASSGVYLPSGWKKISPLFGTTKYFCCEGCKNQYEKSK